MIRSFTMPTAFAAIMLVAGGGAAQPGSPPPAGPGPGGGGGVPGAGNPYARPMEMGETDTATMPSAIEQIRRGTQAASDAQAAERARSKYGPAHAAKPSDVVAQAAVFDMSGETVGKIEAVDADGAVVVTAAGKAKVPLSAFGKNRQGLLIGVSKKEFEAQVARANAG